MSASGQTFFAPEFFTRWQLFVLSTIGSRNHGSRGIHLGAAACGTPEVIAKHVDSNATFSPDGKNIAYVRDNIPDAGKWQLLEADADGSGEKALLVTALPKDSPTSVAWSPDGKEIAVSFFSFREKWLGEIQIFDFASNQLKPFAEYDDKLPFDLAWAPDGQAIYLVCVIRNKRTSLQQQLASVSFPDGKFRMITNDTDTHRGVTISADGKTLRTVRYPHHK